MGFYGNIFDNLNNSSTSNNTQFQFDKIYSNRYLLDITAPYDSIYNGRYVLVDYDKDLTATIPRALKNDDSYYYYNPDWKNLEWKNLDKITSYIQNGYIYILESDSVLKEKVPSLSDGCQFLQYTDDGIFTEENDLQSFKNDFKSNTNQSIHNFNYFIDHQKYEKSYDSTVWQKTYINGESIYNIIAELNADNPTFNLLVKPPEPNGLSSIPQINIESENEYKLILSTQPGLRISDKIYYEVDVYRANAYYNKNGEKITDTIYNPNIEYYDSAENRIYDPSYNPKPDEKNVRKFYSTVFMPNEFYYEVNGEMVKDAGDDTDEKQPVASADAKYYIKISDTRVIKSYYEDNDTIKNESYDGAIFYNAEGLDKKARKYVDINNSVIFIQDGVSGYNYSSDYYYEYLDNIDSNNFINYRDNNNLYYMVDNNSGYHPVDSDGVFDSNKKYYIRYTTSEGKQIDTNQLSICLPAIGNMVAEGWDRIYGKERHLGLKYYNADLNKAEPDPTTANETINTDTNSIAGLFNTLVDQVVRVVGYSENTVEGKTEVVAKSLSLNKIEETNTDGKEVSRYVELKNNDVLQNQIEINNLGIKSIADKIGLDYSNAIGYELITNITTDSYQPNLYYYIDPSTNEYKLDSTDAFTSGREYYVPRINNVELSDNSINGTIQNQINENYNQREANREDLVYRRADIHNLVDLIGLNKAEEGTATTAATLSIKSEGASNVGENEQKIYDNTIQGQIYRNDADITNLIELLGFSRAGYDQLDGINQELTIVNNNDDQISESLQNQITYNDYDIQKIVNRIRRIEEFLEDGHFLFTFGRSANIKDYYYDNLQPLPGEEDEDRYILASTYIDGVKYYTKSKQNGNIIYTEVDVTANNFIKNEYYRQGWIYSKDTPAQSYIPF